MNSKIVFGTDGWRAVIAEDFTITNVQLCAQAVANYLKENNLENDDFIVGFDTRFGSQLFAEKVAEVIAGNDIHVYLTQTHTPTPVISYNVKNMNASGAIIITASHNSAKWNGFKIKLGYGGSAPPETISNIEKNIELLESSKTIPSTIPIAEGIRDHKIEYFDPKPSYIEHIKTLVDLESIQSKPFKIGIDSMYGAAMGYISEILANSNVSISEINNTVNPIFPGIKNPEPIVQNLANLKTLVLMESLTIGVATDGDGDRVGVIDENGQYLSALQVFSILVFYFLNTKKEKGTIVKSITTSKMVNKLADLYGQEVIETKVGFKYLGPAFMESNAILAGEESGGFGFINHIPERDGILSALYLIEAIAKIEKPLSEIMNTVYRKVGTHHYDRLDLNFPESSRENIEQNLTTTRPTIMLDIPITTYSSQDGHLYTLLDDSWVLVRFSGTEPLIRIYAESSSRENVQKLIGEARKLTGV